jgi:hypothetical protein
MRFSRVFMLAAAAASCAAAALTPAAALGAETTSQTFSEAGEHPFAVPTGVTSVQITVVGGNGGSGLGGAPGGTPATVTGTLAVIPGEVLYSEVAGNGASASSEGIVRSNGGGG